jgi:hypothetical protein
MKLLDSPKARGMLVLTGLTTVGLFATWLLVFVLFPVTQTEVLRKPSPTGVITAIVKELHSGNSTSYGYDVYLEQSSLLSNRAKVASFYRAYRNETSRGVDLEWLSPNELLIRYLHAEVTSPPKTTVQCGNQTIRIQLRSEVKSPVEHSPTNQAASQAASETESQAKK